MPSAKQIAARKAFVKKYAKKGKRSKSKKSKFDKTGKKKDMIAGVDYYKDMKTLLGNSKQTRKRMRK